MDSWFLHYVMACAENRELFSEVLRREHCGGPVVEPDATRDDFAVTENFEPEQVAIEDDSVGLHLICSEGCDVLYILQYIM